MPGLTSQQIGGKCKIFNKAKGLTSQHIECTFIQAVNFHMWAADGPSEDFYGLTRQTAATEVLFVCQDSMGRRLPTQGVMMKQLLR